MMHVNWGMFSAVFLAAGVEWVEAFTIVLAVGITASWRTAMGGALTAMLLLSICALAGGGLLIRLGDHIGWLRGIVGAFLILFGLRWLAKAIARHAGLKDLHDEAKEFSETREVLAHANRRASWLIAFKGVLLEGLEVCLIVIALGMKDKQLAGAGIAALAALAVVACAGLLVKAPLSRVPENTIKFVVGSMLLSFGTLWSMEAMAGTGVWWDGDLSLLPLLGIFLGGGLLTGQWLRVSVRKTVEAQP
ncbi:MAG: High-affinity Fe2+/Pb2+ permease [Gammaproteobacteria bacterium]|nr:High-affinity Fe2+/Pb2+ permease [Gammaproteobacteria bacterium]MDE2345963.1 High-affinity Fe2+/Pb2+ permease [Gammaproteobacteria bacterium]